MPDITWIMQTNMGADSDIQTYVAAVRASGAHVVEVSIVPFSGELPDISSNGPIVVYGAVSFVTDAQLSGRWYPGVFASPDVFTYEQWAEHYGSMLLNSPDAVECTTVGAFRDTQRPADADIFVRPQHDTKAIVGEVLTVGKFRDWCISACSGHFAGVNADTKIIIGTPYGIEAEWRLFIVDSEIVGASQYRWAGRMKQVHGAPDTIMTFGRSVIKAWNPAPAYVLDVCLSGGRPYIVEAQGFNSSGHYATDLNPVVAAVNRMAMSLYQTRKRNDSD